MVLKDSPLKTVGDVDRPGHRISVGPKSGSMTCSLTRTLKHAEPVRAEVGGRRRAMVQLFLKHNLDAAAGVRQPLEAYAKTDPDVRVMSDRFMEIRQAMGTHHGRDAGAAYIKAFVEEMKASGFVADALARSGQKATVAPMRRSSRPYRVPDAAQRDSAMPAQAGTHSPAIGLGLGGAPIPLSRHAAPRPGHDPRVDSTFKQPRVIDRRGAIAPGFKVEGRGTTMRRQAQVSLYDAALTRANTAASSAHRQQRLPCASEPFFAACYQMSSAHPDPAGFRPPSSSTASSRTTRSPP